MNDIAVLLGVLAAYCTVVTVFYSAWRWTVGRIIDNMNLAHDLATGTGLCCKHRRADPVE